VIDKHARPHRLELEDARRAGRGLGHFAATAGSEHPMRIDAVADWTVERIAQCELDGIALADADHRAGHGSIVGPIMIADSLGEEPGNRPGFEGDANELRLTPVDRRRDCGRGQPLEVRWQIGNQSLADRRNRRGNWRGFVRFPRLSEGGA
jgi:hypothetical protein